MSEAWRNGYDAWKLATPPWLEEDEDEEAREDAEAMAFHLKESAYMEERDAR